MTYNVTLPSNDASATSSAQIVKQAVTSGALPKTARVKSCVGKASASDKLKTVRTYSEVELFVSRVHPSMNENAIVEFVIEALEYSSVAANANDALIQCDKLPTKYDMYTSYHVTVKVSTLIFRDVIELLMSSEVWPMGLLVKRFFKKRNVNSNE